CDCAGLQLFESWRVPAPLTIVNICPCAVAAAVWENNPVSPPPVSPANVPQSRRSRAAFSGSGAPAALSFNLALCVGSNGSPVAGLNVPKGVTRVQFHLWTNSCGIGLVEVVVVEVMVVVVSVESPQVGGVARVAILQAARLAFLKSLHCRWHSLPTLFR